jgi:hypothetical protein
MADPTWYPAWPSGAPDFETQYKNATPRQFPARLYVEGGEAFLDQQALGVILSWIRKGSWWISDRIFPWKDAGEMFLALWENVFSLEASRDLDKRQRRIVAAMRNRGTGTLERIKAIFQWVFPGVTDPDDISVTCPTPAQAWGYNRTWTRLPQDAIPTTQQLNALGGFSETEVFAVGDNGKAYAWVMSPPLNWIEVTTGTAQHLNGIWGYKHGTTSDSLTWLVGDNGAIRESLNGGAFGAGPVGGPANNIEGVWGSGEFYDTGDSQWKPRYMYTCGAGNEISRYDVQAAAWTNWNFGATTYTDIHATDHDDIWTCGADGTVARWNGAAWSNTTPNANTWWGIRTVFIDGAQFVWVVGNGGLSYRLTVNGMSWAAKATGSADHFYGLDGYEEDKLLAVGVDGQCIWYDGTQWLDITTSCHEDLFGVWIDRTSCYSFACGQNGWTKRAPGPGGHEGFAIQQNCLHIYHTGETVDPDYYDGLSLCIKSKPAKDLWSCGKNKGLEAGTTIENGADMNSAHED